MRELKFRAWDKDCKGYCSGCDIGNLLIGVAYNNDRKSEIVEDKILAKHFTLEQYTGLKDKNGKEIYEGDIIKEIILGDAVIWRVRWDENECCYSLDHLSGLVGGTEVEDSMLTREDEENVEVIGNIHENPELLEGEE